MNNKDIPKDELAKLEFDGKFNKGDHLSFTISESGSPRALVVTSRRGKIIVNDIKCSLRMSKEEIEIVEKYKEPSYHLIVIHSGKIISAGNIMTAKSDSKKSNSKLTTDDAKN